MNDFKNTVAIIQEDVISQRIRIAELEAQIEKMKCCGNCKSMQRKECSFKKMEYFKSDDCRQWELAE